MVAALRRFLKYGVLRGYVFLHLFIRKFGSLSTFWFLQMLGHAVYSVVRQSWGKDTPFPVHSLSLSLTVWSSLTLKIFLSVVWRWKKELIPTTTSSPFLSHIHLLLHAFYTWSVTPTFIVCSIAKLSSSVVGWITHLTVVVSSSVPCFR